MMKLDECVTTKQAARLLGVCCNTLRGWDLAGVIPVRRHSKNNYRLFAVADLERIRKEIRATGTYPGGWQRPRRPKQTPRLTIGTSSETKSTPGFAAA